MKLVKGNWYRERASDFVEFSFNLVMRNQFSYVLLPVFKPKYWPLDRIVFSRLKICAYQIK